MATRMKKDLRQLDAGLAHVQEVAVVQGLQAQVVELLVALGLQGRAQAGQVELQQLRGSAARAPRPCWMKPGK